MSISKSCLRLIIFLLFTTWSATVFSQTAPPANSTPKGSTSKNVVFSGNLGLFGEMYDKSADNDRRPGSTGRIYFRPTLSFYHSISISMDLMLSTEGNSKRQNINQLDFNPKWSWGNAHLGDFTDNYSSLTLNGIRVRGGSLSINPRKFRFSTIAGQTRRATSNSSSSRSFSRSLYGGRIGIGRTAGSWVDLIVLKMKDDASSLPPLNEQNNTEDSTQTTLNPWSVYPADNLIMAISSNLRLFDKKVTWENELAGSAYTRNTEGSVVTDEDIPSWTEKIFKVHLGSRGDLAYKTDIKYSSKSWMLSSGYEFIGPGYISLGMSSQISDKQAIRLGGMLRQKNWTLSLNGVRENDNLIDQKNYTTVRQRLTGVLNIKPLSWWNLIFNGNLLSMTNNAENDTLLIDNSNVIVSINQIFNFSNTRRIQSVSVNYVIQRSSDSNSLRENSRLRSQSIDLRMAIKAAAQITVTPSVGLVASQIGTSGSKTTTILNLNALYKSKSDKFTAGLTLGPTFSGDSHMFRTMINSAYRFNRSNQIQTDIKFSDFSNDGTGRNYNEIIWNLNLTHQF